MRLRKKMVLFLILVLLSGLWMMAHSAAESGTAGNLTWTLDKGVLTVNGTGKFPAKGPWMEYAKKIKEIELGDEVEGLETLSLDGFPALTYVHFGAGIDQVGVFDFGNVPKLKRLRFSGPMRGLGIPIRVDEIIFDNEDTRFVVVGNYVCSNTILGIDGETYCLGNLKGTVILPKTFSTVSMYSFNNMKNMKAIILNGKVSGIYNYAFTGCTALQAVTIPATVKNMGDAVFSGCKALKQVVFLGETVSLGMTFNGCTGIQEIVLPATDKVKTDCFRDCTALKKVVLGEGTISIAKNAFRGSGKLTGIYIPESVMEIDEEAFDSSQTKLVFQCREGSFAENYLKEHGYKYEIIKPVESIALNESEITLDAGKTAQVKADVQPADATSRKVIWASSDEQVLSVKEGKVKALAGGECDLYCIAADGSNLRAVCHVSVTEKIKSLQPSEKKYTLPVGETWQAMVTIKPETATNRILVWNSSDESVCTVDETGLITAVGKGKCVISCVATDGSKKTAKISLTVTEE